MPQNLVLIGEDQIDDPAFNGGAGVKVAIIDTGIDVDNTDLNVVGGVSFIEGTTYDDDNGHGTALAGIIGAKANDSGLVGIAPPGAELYAVKALDNNGTGYYSDVIKALEWCTENRMDIVVMSFGADEYSGILHEAVQTFYLQDGLMVAAAGNTDSSVQYPAAYSEVMAVGAVDEANEILELSNSGQEIDLVAIGKINDALGIDGQYHTVEGTSVSAAIVAGIAAELKGDSIDSSGGDNIKSILNNSTIPYGDRNSFGNGVLNAMLVYENKNNAYSIEQSDVIYDITSKLVDNQLVNISFKHPTYDNQSISVGEKVTVRAGFYDDHDKCVITLYKSGDESNAIDTHTRSPIAGLAGDDSTPIYTSNYVTYTTPTMTEAGTYKIRYHCPDNGNNDSDDIFTFTVRGGGGEGSQPEEPKFPIDIEVMSIDLRNSDGTVPQKLFIGQKVKVPIEIKNSGSVEYSGSVELELLIDGLSKNLITKHVKIPVGDTITIEAINYPYWVVSSGSRLAVNVNTLVGIDGDTSTNYKELPIITLNKPNLNLNKSSFNIPESYSKVNETNVAVEFDVYNRGGGYESGTYDIEIHNTKLVD